MAKVYATVFYNERGERIGDGARPEGYDPARQTERFQGARLKHIRRGLHHWEAWVVIGHGGKLSALEMPDAYCKEMVADVASLWSTRGHVQAVRRAWSDSGYIRVLHHLTSARVECLLNQLEGG